MNWGSWLLWGFVATLVLTTTMVGSQGLGLTRMNIPFMLGTIFTSDRDKAKVYGFFVHFVNGWIFSILYVLAFASLNKTTWWLGAIIGLAHALFVLVVMMSLLPSFHPRMASEQHGPTASRKLEPPGFMAMHYGIRTPIAVVLSHLVYGAILGAFYSPR